MTFADFQKAVSARFPDRAFKFDKDLTAMYAATDGFQLTMWRIDTSLPWELVLSNAIVDVTANGATLDDAANDARSKVASLLQLARAFGLEPQP